MLFQHWTYSSFPAGSLQRRHYDMFQELMSLERRCYHRIVALQAMHTGQMYGDWSYVETLCNELEQDAISLVTLLRKIYPLYWIDIIEYTSKVAFYARLAVSTQEPDFAPPYIVEHGHADGDHNTVYFEVSPTAYFYFIEYNGLRDFFDSRLQYFHTVDSDGAQALCMEMQGAIMQANLPEEIETSLLDAAFRLASDNEVTTETKIAYTERQPFIATAECIVQDGLVPNATPRAAFVLGEQSALPSTICTVYKLLLAEKYCAHVITARIECGLADSEVGVRVCLRPSSSTLSASSVGGHSCFKEQAASKIKACLQEAHSVPQSLSIRLALAMPHISHMHLQDILARDFIPKNIHSLHDVTRFCHTMAFMHMFDMMQKERKGPQGTQGLLGARMVRSQLPVLMRVLNLHDGLFATAIGKEHVSPEDFRCTPLWAFWFGLQKAAEEMHIVHSKKKDSPVMACYAIIENHFVHMLFHFQYCTLIIEADVLDASHESAFLDVEIRTGHSENARNSMILDTYYDAFSAMGLYIEQNGGMLRASSRPYTGTTKDGKMCNSQAKFTENTLQRHIATMAQLLWTLDSGHVHEG